MNDVHFKSLDLNLLRVFEALYAERSATLAGTRLGLSQSAVSHGLGRLRQALGDELFLRDATGLQPTPRAVALGPAISDAMKALEIAIGASAFDASRSDRHFVVGATAYICTVLLPAVMPRFMSGAPHARLRVRAENLSAEELDRGRLDVIFGAFEDLPPRFAFEPLFSETGVWVLREDHPALRRGRDVAALAGLPQVLIAPDEAVPGARVASGLKRQSLWEAIRGTEGGEGVLTVPDTYSALVMVRRTDLVALLPRRLAEVVLDRGLTMIEPAHAAPPFQVGAVTRAGEQGAIPWLLGLMREAAAGL
ncbi:PCP degradation transcriptional activation protein [Alphaproteobacteria bacterium SO-S41]|nr:PCP degradation transcriptional activation protein [Alphaproteobacteria bacterium SO-S41]